ncbi:MAG: hypothetical protein ACKOZY_10705 [Flavobacteriales bacterium]
MFKNFSIFLIFTSLYAFSYVFFKEPFEFYLAYLIFVIYFPFFFTKFGIPKWPVLLFVPLFFSGILYCLTGDNTTQQFFKIFIGFFASTMFYHYVIQAYDFDLKLLFKYYMRSAYIVTIIGVVQLISYPIGFKPGYNFLWIFNKWNPSFGGLGVRMSSVLSEPAYFAAIIAPAFFVSVYNVIKRQTLFITQFQSYLIMIVYPLSFSSLGILAIFFTLIFLLINLGFVRYSVIMIPLLTVIVQYSYKNVPEFRDRWDGTIEIYTTDNIYSYDIHGSSFVLYNNSHVAWENFKVHPIFGTGLGSHPTAFDKYTLTNVQGAVQIDFNKMDANSMLLRLMSETGAYGLFVMVLLLIRSWIFKPRSSDDVNWVMSNGLAMIILIYLIRQGHYFLNGFPLFLWMFYYLSVQNKREFAELKAMNRATEKAKFVSANDAGPTLPAHT